MDCSLIVSYKFHMPYLRGGGENADELPIANVHFHGTNDNNARYAHFWDILCQLILAHRVRVIVGDFSMSLRQVIPELRSRGFLVQKLWSCWQHKA